MNILPATEASATDEVIDAIAEIEMQRRETEKKSGFAAACGSALERLSGLLDHESKALALRGTDAGHPGNVDALELEIVRVKALTAATAQESIPRYVRTEQRQVSWHDAPRESARKQGAQNDGTPRWAVTGTSGRSAKQLCFSAGSRSSPSSWKSRNGWFPDGSKDSGARRIP